MSDPDEYDYFSGKKPSRTYVTKRITRKAQDGITTRNIRGVSKVFDIEDFKEYIKEKKQVVLYKTPSERQEVKAWVDEDTRGFSLSIQRFQVESGFPHKNTCISFSKAGLQRLFDFVESLGYLDFSTPHGKKLEDKDITDIKRIIEKYADDPEVTSLLAAVSKTDIAAVAYRRNQLKIFQQLLDDREFFDQKKIEWSKARDEDVWQYFFQTNQWIFGYGLNYIFNSPVDESQIQQKVRGQDVSGGGKTVDALLKTRGFISSLVLVEIKTHETALVKELKTPYRREAWALSDEFNGGIVQSQRNIEETLRNTRLSPLLKMKDKSGDPTGEVLHSYQPKSYLVIGSLKEFVGEHGVNEEKFSSFELYRRSLNNPEVITFDELYERATHIVQHGEEEVARINEDESTVRVSEVEVDVNPEDIPF